MTEFLRTQNFCLFWETRKNVFGSLTENFSCPYSFCLALECLWNEKNKVLKNKLIWKAFQNKEGWCSFLISFLLPEIFNFFLISKVGTDGIASREVWGSKHKRKNISGNNWSIKLKLGRFATPKNVHQLVYILMLLWQHTRFQISIMQEW